MKRTQTNLSRRGFSLIELLVVIAIIAILAAILFPAIVAQQKKAKRNSCAANLATIAGGLRMYKLDTGEYPPALFGFAHAGGEGTSAEIKSGATEVYGLYPHWVRSRTDFVCPDNPVTRLAPAKDIMWMPNDPQYPTHGRMTPPLSAPEMRKGVWSGTSQTDLLYPSGISFPMGDSYDATYAPDTAFRAGTGGWERHYQRQWTPVMDLSNPNVKLGGLPLLPLPTVGTDRDRARTYARQLVFKLPDDATVVTACTYHREYPKDWARAADFPMSPTHAQTLPPESMDVVLFLDGHTEFRQSEDFNVYQNMDGVTQWAGWQVGSK
jgi:prepilin-type N-terminal cleavage/methylation domain-containing protein